jgi:hypothetical protein
LKGEKKQVPLNSIPVGFFSNWFRDISIETGLLFCQKIPMTLLIESDCKKHTAT